MFAEVQILFAPTKKIIAEGQGGSRAHLTSQIKVDYNIIQENCKVSANSNCMILSTSSKTPHTYSCICITAW